MKNLKLKIANGASQHSHLVKNVTVSWSDMLRVLSDFKVKPNDRSYMLAGQCPSGIRGSKQGDAVRDTCLAMIDLDAKDLAPLSWDELVFDLELSLPFAWAAYTTRSYTGESVNFRIIVPFAASLSAAKHGAAVAHVMGLLPDTYRQWFDACSERADQPIFLPCLMNEASPHHATSGGDDFLDFTGVELEADDEHEADDLDDLISAMPLNITDSEVSCYLDALDPNTLTYGGDEGVFGWLDVGMALAHQYGKADAGFDLWVSWSARNVEKHTLRGMAGKYKSFDVVPRGRRPLTFSSVISQVKDRGGLLAIAATGGTDELTPMQRMLAAAERISNLDEYNAYKSKVLAFNHIILPNDARAMLAHEIAKGFGKTSGLTKTIILKALTPKKETADEDGGGELPDWAAGWCYIEKSCEFYHIPSDHAIVKEAFNARYDREADCIIAERTASQLVLISRGLPTYANRMYWPGAGTVFSDGAGNQMVNAYVKGGAAPSAIDAKGQAAIDIMLAHLNMLVPNAREQEIILDWFTHVYQHPGERINWALLMQGAQGTGKSYFAVLMGRLLGRNARTLEANAIAERFTAWAHGSTLTTIEEIRISGTSKFNILDRMKPFITNETIQIEEKGKDHRTVPNFTNYLMLTNHKDALPIGDGDRRYCVIYTAIQTEGDLFDLLGGEARAVEYFNRLFNTMDESIGSIATYFQDRIISENFKPLGRAPDTESRKIMQLLSVSGERDSVENAISIHECPVINSDVIDITWLHKLCESENFELPKTRALSSVLSEMGYEPLSKRVNIAKTRAKHSVWVRSKVKKSKNYEEIVKAFHQGKKLEIDETDCLF